MTYIVVYRPARALQAETKFYGPFTYDKAEDFITTLPSAADLDNPAAPGCKYIAELNVDGKGNVRVISFDGKTKVQIGAPKSVDIGYAIDRNSLEPFVLVAFEYSEMHKIGASLPMDKAKRMLLEIKKVITQLETGAVGVPPPAR